MLRGFRKPYKKLFDGEVFTTVRLWNHDKDHPKKDVRFIGDLIGKEDVIYLYPRTKRALRQGTAQILAVHRYPSIGFFDSFCSEDFAQYDAELSKVDFIISLKRQAKRRKMVNPWVILYTYLWTEKEEGYYEAKEGMQE